MCFWECQSGSALRGVKNDPIDSWGSDYNSYRHQYYSSNIIVIGQGKGCMIFVWPETFRDQKHMLGIKRDCEMCTSYTVSTGSNGVVSSQTAATLKL